MSKSKFVRLAEKHRIEFQHTPGGKERGPFSTGQIFPWQICVDAPTGFFFTATDLHCDCGIGGNDGEVKTDWKLAHDALKELIDGGLSECEDPECDMCHPEE